ncbi:HlyD family secretion protein [Filimonas lacunae]|uniref:HlyD family secretion protein n=1 Tax=Filimonas lacunae TaxID=477680 RepID=UPI0013563558|nr:HlyD family efflux transporter periplasmic adaptor subunit [Filimonas lacunae]
MQTKIFPAGVIENSVEKHFHDYHPQTKAIYLVVLAAILIAFVSLFFIKVDISVRSAGAFRSVTERTEIRASVSGVVESVSVAENAPVSAGQPLFKVDARQVNEKSALENNHYAELQAQLHDLEIITGSSEAPLQTRVYRQQYSLYQQRITDARVKLNTASRTYNRYSSLYKGNVVSSAEFEKYEYEKNAAEGELSLIKQQQFSQWHGDMMQLRLQLQELQASRQVTAQEKGLYTVNAPVSGYVQQLKGIQKGSFVSAGELLGEITPDNGLIAEAYVSTTDIGLLKKGTPVRMQVDAFDYNSWGMLTGTVQSVSEDVFTAEGQPPYFKVRCVIGNSALQLRNGYKAQIKKGMTMHARFLITSRTLYQLLYDKIDDWLNPNNAA